MAARSAAPVRDKATMNRFSAEDDALVSKRFLVGLVLGVLICLAWLALFYKYEDWWGTTAGMILCPGLVIQLFFPLEATGKWVMVANMQAVVANGIIYGLTGLLIPLARKRK